MKAAFKGVKLHYLWEFLQRFGLKALRREWCEWVGNLLFQIIRFDFFSFLGLHFQEVNPQDVMRLGGDVKISHVLPEVHRESRAITIPMTRSHVLMMDAASAMRVLPTCPPHCSWDFPTTATATNWSLRRCDKTSHFLYDLRSTSGFSCSHIKFQLFRDIVAAAEVKHTHTRSSILRAV